MPSTKEVATAFQAAVDRALCQVSREPFDRLEAEGRDATVGRINTAMKELAKLGTPEQQPNYSDPDVALFYSQWYLPQQINVTYSESARILSQSLLPSRNWVQIVDFGAGTGAMTIGLVFATATRPRGEWPEGIVVYQIDDPVMLELGHDLWASLHDAARHYPVLTDLAEVMDRTSFECVPRRTESGLDAIPVWEDAIRWRTAIHVVYRDDMATINSQVQSLDRRLRPHVQMRTAPSFKADYLDAGEELAGARRDLGGSVPGITSIRRDVWGYTGAVPSQRAHRYLDNLHRWVSWKSSGKDNVPVAEIVYGPEVTRYV